MKTTIYILIVSACLLCVSAIARADVCDLDTANNILWNANCGFDSDIASWTILNGSTASHNSGQGAPSAGSLQVDSVDNMVHETIFQSSGCHVVIPNTTYGFGIRIAKLSGVNPSCFVTLIAHDESGCSAITGFGQATASPVDTTFVLASSDYTTSGAQIRVSFEVRCDAGASFSILADNAFLGATLTTPVELLEFTIE
jgi:hypothetical protein